MRDHAYDAVPFRLSEMEHRYGANVHILANPFLLTQLAALSAKTTQQPAINQLVARLYGELVTTVINAEFPRRRFTVPTRMIDKNPRGIFFGEGIDPDVRAVTVNIARAGTLPSQVCYDLLNHLIEPRLVRQDHIVMSRMLDDAETVTGAGVGGAKIGGDVENAFVLFPDPMGATGSSLSTALRLYRDEVQGTPRRMICLNLIVTPEYLKRISTDHPDVAIYALRLDRGLSEPDVLETIPGTHWDREKGLDEHQYIVPGAGGLGEIMNNAFV